MEERIENQAAKIPIPIVTVAMIIKEAEKERIGNIHNLFKEFIAKHSKYRESH